MTNDHRYIMAPTLGKEVYFYKFDGASYVLQQTITLENNPNPYYFRSVWIQDYMDEILIPDQHPTNSQILWMKTFSFDSTTEQFSHVSTKEYTEGIFYRDHIITQDRKYMALVNYENLLIVGGLEKGEQEILEIIPIASADRDSYWDATMSNDGSDIYLSFTNGKVYVYKSCFNSEQTSFYESNGECFHCNTSLNMYI